MEDSITSGQIAQDSSLTQSWCARVLRPLRRCLEWLITGVPESLPHFVMKRHAGLVDTYERLVGSLLDSALVFCSGSVPADLQAIADEFEVLRNPAGQRNERPSHDERFKRLLKLDAKLIAVLPAALLLERRWMMIDRLRRIAPERAVVLYESTKPASLALSPAAAESLSEGEEAKLRADLIILSNYMQQLNILNVQREQALASIKWWLLSRLLGLCGAIALIFAIISLPVPKSWPIQVALPGMMFGLLLIFLTGMTGAVTSIGRKFQDIASRNVLVGDPFNEIVALNSGRQSVALSIVIGGVFALFLYLVIVSGTAAKIGLDLVLFPAISEQKTVTVTRNDIEQLTAQPNATTAKPPAAVSESPKNSGEKTDGTNDKLVLQIPRQQDINVLPGIATVSRALGFFYYADILRMLLLAFLAGFAERLVPDAIDRLARREKAAAGNG